MSPKRLLTLAGVVALWAGAVYGSTRLHQLDWELGHGICGPWGCAAAPQALVGYHAFWLTLLAPSVLLVCRVAGFPAGRRIALTAASVGLLGLVGLGAYGSIQWLQDGGDANYVAHRALFVCATTPDAPFLPLIVGGLGGAVVARRAGAAGRGPQPVEAGPLERENAVV